LNKFYERNFVHTIVLTYGRLKTTPVTEQAKLS